MACNCLSGYPFTWPQPDFANRRLRDMPTQLPVGAIGNYTRGVFDEQDPYATPSYARGDAGVDGFGEASLLDPLKSVASDVAQAAYNAAAATAQAAYDAATGATPKTGQIYVATGILPLVNQTTISTSAPVARTSGIVSGGTLSRLTLTKKADTTTSTASTSATAATTESSVATTTKSSVATTALKVAGLAGAALLLAKLLKG